MNIELIDDEEPRGDWIGGHRLGDMPRKVFFGSAWSDRRRHHSPSRYVEVGNQTLRPVAEIFILGALDQAWLQRQGGSSALQRLYPGLLICPDNMPPLLGDGWRVLVRLTHRRHLGRKRHRVIWLGVEPVLHPSKRSQGVKFISP